MAVVAAPKRAMRERTETWPTNVAMASNTNTPYTYGCCVDDTEKEETFNRESKSNVGHGRFFSKLCLKVPDNMNSML